MLGALHLLAAIDACDAHPARISLKLDKRRASIVELAISAHQMLKSLAMSIRTTQMPGRRQKVHADSVLHSRRRKGGVQ